MSTKTKSLKLHDRVYWTDPDEGHSNGVYKVERVINPEVILIGNGVSEAEVPPHELRLLPNLKFYSKAKDNVHFEFEAGGCQQEVEVYIGGYYLCSVSVDNISEEARRELFEKG